MTLVRQAIENWVKKHGPIPKSFTFGDGIAWDSQLLETHLYVELPFWLMVPPGDVRVKYLGLDFTVTILGPWREVFMGEFTDSRQTCIHQGPRRPEPFQPKGEFAAAIKDKNLPVMERGCKTVLRLTALAHEDAFMEEGPDEPPRAKAENRAYWASLCEAHIPVVNEVIQRYRLTTYDYFAYEVSAWDIPVWYLKQSGQGYRAVLHPYREWDSKPVILGEPATPGAAPTVRQFEWAKPADLESVSTANASPGEFDLLDARSMMERGDYTGAVRRTTTAIEALIGAKLEEELRKKYDDGEVAKKLEASQNDVPGRIRQWRKLSKSPISQRLFDEFENTRNVRHGIVHRADRLTLNDRGRAQRMIDTGRWLYNQLEGKPERTKLRDYGVLKAVGRVAMTVRFPAKVIDGALVLQPLTGLPDAKAEAGEEEPRP